MPGLIMALMFSVMGLINVRASRRNPQAPGAGVSGGLGWVMLGMGLILILLLVVYGIARGKLPDSWMG